MILSVPLVFSHKIKCWVDLQYLNFVQNLGNVHIENSEQKQTECVFVWVEGNNILL